MRTSHLLAGLMGSWLAFAAGAQDRDTVDPTASDPSPPGEAARQGDARSLVGAPVVTEANARLGEVEDIVFDAKRQPAYVILSTGQESTAVPYGVVDGMRRGDKVIMQEARLKAAPKLKEDEWRTKTGADWQVAATEYWSRGS